MMMMMNNDDDDDASCIIFTNTIHSTNPERDVPDKLIQQIN